MVVVRVDLCHFHQHDPSLHMDCLGSALGMHIVGFFELNEMNRLSVEVAI